MCRYYQERHEDSSRYWSHQSPYCYFVLDRLLALNGQDDVEVELRPVLPGVIRDGGLFAGRAEIERAERVNGSKLPPLIKLLRSSQNLRSAAFAYCVQTNYVTR